MSRIVQSLERMVIKGYKSIRSCDIELNSINVLIGSNGAGKSNFLSVFYLLKEVLGRNLSRYVSKRDGASSLLYNGRKVTDSIVMEFYFNASLYAFDLEWTQSDGLFFREERIENSSFTWREAGHHESYWQIASRDLINVDDIRSWASTPWNVFHFYDTGLTSKIKERHNIFNNDCLRVDAANLGAFLYRLREFYPKEFNNILSAVKLVVPFFEDFVLKPEEGNQEQIVLRWKKRSCDDIFNAYQLSDGTLRFICLTVLLLQPTELRPAVIIIDEPELGLHPFALSVLAEMAQKASVDKQVILATQSVEFLDCFEVEDVIVVDNDENGSKFKRLEREQLKYWLENDYSLGELWVKNVLGGRFSR